MRPLELQKCVAGNDRALGSGQPAQEQVVRLAEARAARRPPRTTSAGAAIRRASASPKSKPSAAGRSPSKQASASRRASASALGARARAPPRSPAPRAEELVDRDREVVRPVAAGAFAQRGAVGVGARAHGQRGSSSARLPTSPAAESANWRATAPPNEWPTTCACEIPSRPSAQSCAYSSTLGAGAAVRPVAPPVAGRAAVPPASDREPRSGRNASARSAPWMQRTGCRCPNRRSRGPRRDCRAVTRGAARRRSTRRTRTRRGRAPAGPTSGGRRL